MTFPSLCSVSQMVFTGQPSAKAWATSVRNARKAAKFFVFCDCRMVFPCAAIRSDRLFAIFPFRCFTFLSNFLLPLFYLSFTFASVLLADFSLFLLLSQAIKVGIAKKKLKQRFLTCY